MDNIIDKSFLREFEFPNDILESAHWEELGTDLSEILFHACIGTDVWGVLDHYVSRYVHKKLCGYVNREIENQMINHLISIHMEDYNKYLDERSRLFE